MQRPGTGTGFHELLRVGYHLRNGWNRLRNPAVRPNGAARAEFYYGIWNDAATNLSAEFIRLPNGFCEIRLGDKVTRIYENIVQIDDPLSVKLVRVKPFVHKQLAAHGIPVPPYREFDLGTLGVAENFLHTVGAPCVVKPASGETAGYGVTTNVRNRRQLVGAAINASLFSRDLLIEHQVEGESYRLLCFDGKILDATKRRPPHIVGDGRSSIRQLIERENIRRDEAFGSSALTRIQCDSDCRATLKRAGLTLHSVPKRGEEVAVKTTVNDNSSRDNLSVLPIVCDDLAREVAAATAVLGIRLAGIDIITKDPGLSLKESGGAVIELNSSPGLHHHYNVSNPGERDPVAVPILRALLGVGEGENRTTVLSTK